MDTKEKYGICKRHAIMLFIQMIFTIIGFISQVGIMLFIAINNLDRIMLISSISIILAFISIFVYAIFGYKRSKFYYLFSISFFLLAILINNILPFRNMFQRIILTMLFGFVSSFIFTQERQKLSIIWLIVAGTLSLVFSMYSSITANPNSLGSVEDNILPAIMMYVSIFTPTIMTGVFGVTYLVRIETKRLKGL